MNTSLLVFEQPKIKTYQLNYFYLKYKIILHDKKKFKEKLGLRGVANMNMFYDYLARETHVFTSYYSKRQFKMLTKNNEEFYLVSPYYLLKAESSVYYPSDLKRHRPQIYPHITNRLTFSRRLMYYYKNVYFKNFLTIYLAFRMKLDEDMRHTLWYWYLIDNKNKKTFYYFDTKNNKGKEALKGM